MIGRDEGLLIFGLVLLIAGISALVYSLYGFPMEITGRVLTAVGIVLVGLWLLVRLRKRQQRLK